MPCAVGVRIVNDARPCPGLAAVAGIDGHVSARPHGPVAARVEQLQRCLEVNRRQPRLPSRAIDHPGFLKHLGERGANGVVPAGRVQNAALLDLPRQAMVIESARRRAEVSEGVPAARIVPGAEVDAPQARAGRIRVKDRRHCKPIGRIRKFFHSSGRLVRDPRRARRRAPPGGPGRASRSAPRAGRRTRDRGAAV